MAYVNMNEYDWAQNTQEYVKFRNIGGDSQCGFWTVWDELGKNPSQENFLAGMKRQHLDIRRLNITAWNNKNKTGSGLLNYGMSKQFYIPNLYNWDVSSFNKDYNSEEEYPNSLLKPCPFCGGQAEFISAYEGQGYSLEDYVAVKCTCCGISTKGINNSVRFKEDAMKLWNRRF